MSFARDGTATITKYNGTAETLDIPAELDAAAWLYK